MRMKSYAGHPTTIANAARMVLPLPYPRAPYIIGANSGNPNPAKALKKSTAASAIPQRVNIHIDFGCENGVKADEWIPDAACRVNASMT